MKWFFDLFRFYFKVLKKYGRPRDIIYCLGGLGDDLCLTVIAKAYFLKYGQKPNIISKRPILFKGNPYINAVLDPIDVNRWGLLVSLLTKITGKKLSITHLAYYHQPINDYPNRSLHQHMLQMMASKIDISPEELDELIEDRSPLLYDITVHADGSLIPTEKFILMHSSSLSAPYPVKIKEWPMNENDNRFLSFCSRYGEDINDNLGALVQIGDISDPALPHAIDLRGKTDLATLALLCEKAVCFIGLEGGIMHFARAYNTPSIIVYGGRTTPEETGYSSSNTINLYNPLYCSPCWGTNDCHLRHKCMTDISEEDVYLSLIALIGNRKSVDSDKISRLY